VDILENLLAGRGPGGGFLKKIFQGVAGGEGTDEEQEDDGRRRRRRRGGRG